jgi:hypothetical protein
MKPASEKLCSCGNTASEWHHPDYAKPLDVEPLCAQCHKSWHCSLVAVGQ